MKKITVNRASALSLLLAAALISRNNEVKVDETDKDGTNFKKRFADNYPEVDLDRNYAVQLLEAEDGRGDNLARGIEALHHENNYDSQVELAAVFSGDKQAIKRVSEAGKAVNSFLNSPSFERESDNLRNSIINQHFGDPEASEESKKQWDDQAVKSQGAQTSPSAADSEKETGTKSVEGPVTNVNPTGEQDGPKTSTTKKGQSDEGKEGDIEDDTKKQ